MFLDSVYVLPCLLSYHTCLCLLWCCLTNSVLTCLFPSTINLRVSTQTCVSSMQVIGWAVTVLCVVLPTLPSAHLSIVISVLSSLLTPSCLTFQPCGIACLITVFFKWPRSPLIFWIGIFRLHMTPCAWKRVRVMNSCCLFLCNLTNYCFDRPAFLHKKYYLVSRPSSNMIWIWTQECI